MCVTHTIVFQTVIGLDFCQRNKGLINGKEAVQVITDPKKEVALFSGHYPKWNGGINETIDA